MARIIPWNLPSVAGGSIGGYTPAPTPPEPEDQQYFDFSDAVISYNDQPNVCFIHWSEQHGIAAGSDYTDDVAALTPTAISGIETVNLIGVSSVAIAVTTSQKVTTNITYDASDVTFNWDFLTNSLSVRTGSFKAANTSASTRYVIAGEFSITQYDFYVYNGNGEVIQTATLEVGGE